MLFRIYDSKKSRSDQESWWRFGLVASLLITSALLIKKYPPSQERAGRIPPAVIATEIMTEMKNAWICNEPPCFAYAQLSWLPITLMKLWNSCLELRWGFGFELLCSILDSQRIIIWRIRIGADRQSHVFPLLFLFQAQDCLKIWFRISEFHLRSR